MAHIRPGRKSLQPLQPGQSVSSSEQQENLNGEREGLVDEQRLA